jgi:hypothetical protein
MLGAPKSGKSNDVRHYCFCQDFKRAGISRLLKEKGREQFWREKRAICIVLGKTRKTDRISLFLGSIKYFPLSFNTFKTL